MRKLTTLSIAAFTAVALATAPVQAGGTHDNDPVRTIADVVVKIVTAPFRILDREHGK